MDIESIEVKKELKIVFMGTPEFSVPILESLIKNYKVKAVISQPDKQVGRMGKIALPPVKIVAQEHNILVIQPNKIREEYQEIIDLNPDIIITCAYGQILPVELLNAPRLGCINVHASLLPKLRGGAPIHRAIMEDYKKTGITIMYMNEKMDAGDIIAQKEIEIKDDDTQTTLSDKLSKLGSELLIQVLPSIIDGTNERIPQNDSEVTFAKIIKPEDEKIDFSKTTKQVYNQIRGLSNFPGAYFYLDGKRVKVFSSIIGEDFYPDRLNGEIVKIYKEGIGVKTSNGVIILTEIQKEGKGKMSAISYVNGMRESLIGKVIG